MGDTSTAIPSCACALDQVRFVLVFHGFVRSCSAQLFASTACGSCSYFMCVESRSSRSNHDFHCPSLIHRCIASGDLVQADREIQIGRGIEPTRKNLVQQFWQIGACWGQPTTHISRTATAHCHLHPETARRSVRVLAAATGSSSRAAWFCRSH